MKNAKKFGSIDRKISYVIINNILLYKKNIIQVGNLIIYNVQNSIEPSMHLFKL